MATDRRFIALAVAFVAFFAAARVAARGAPPVVLAAIAIVLLALVCRHPRARARLGLTLARWPEHVALGIGAVAVITAGLLASVAVFFGEHVAGIVWREILAIPLADRGQFLAMGIAAAIGEEVVFRGLLQPTAIRHLGYAGGIVAVAAAFALSHPKVYQWPPFHLINMLMIGTIYGVLRGRDRALTGSLVAHTLTWVAWGNT